MKYNKVADTLVVNGKTVLRIYRNIIVLITDGYIETGLQNCHGNNSASKKSYCLGQNEITDFRTAFNNSQSNDLREFLIQKGYGLHPIQNDVISNFEILAIEIYDRSMDMGGSATVRPTDYQILSVFWEDWMKNSRVKKFIMYETANSVAEFERAFLSFLGIQ